MDNFYLSQTTGTCQEKKLISAALKPIVQPEIFRLLFSNDWAELFGLIPDKHTISINDLPRENFTYSLFKDESVPNSFLLSIEFSKQLYETSLATKLKISIDPAVTSINSKNTTLNASSFEFNLEFSREKCVEGKIWKEGNFEIK